VLFDVALKNHAPANQRLPRIVSAKHWSLSLPFAAMDAFLLGSCLASYSWNGGSLLCKFFLLGDQLGVSIASFKNARISTLVREQPASWGKQDIRIGDFADVDSAEN
jgi:hypothetical protein